VPAPIGPSQTLFPTGPPPPTPTPLAPGSVETPSSALPCAAPGAPTSALPRAAPGALTPARPRAAPGTPAPAQPRAAPTVPPGFAPLSPATPARASPAPGLDPASRQAARPLPTVQPYDRVYTRRSQAAPPPPPITGTPPLPKRAVPVVPVINEHRMVTRAKPGFRQPALFTAAPLSPVPKTFRNALADPNWRAAMEEEHAALLRNHT
jgi:hypothetical protein